MSLAGLGIVAIWHDLLPEAKAEFYEWHQREHMPERSDIPGFRRGRRYIAVEGEQEYFNLYEADSPEVLCGADYLTRLNHPTPWTKKVVVSFRNVTRGICRVVYSDGVGQGGSMLTLRFDVSPTLTDSVIGSLQKHLLPPLVDAKGIAGVHLCCTDAAVSKIETAEKKARSDGTEVPGWILMIEGMSRTSVSEASVHVRKKLEQLGVTNFMQSIYAFEYQRCKFPGGDR